MKTLYWIVLALLSISSCFAAENNREKDLQAFGDFATLQTQVAGAQQQAAVSTDAGVLASDKLAHEFQVLKEQNKVQEIFALCLFAIVSLVVVLYFLTRKMDGDTGTNIVHATGIIFIVVGTISLVIMAETEQQLTAAIGILGAIAGYLFGSMKHKPPASEEKETAASK